MSKNETKITAEKGKQEVFIVREFDAPRELVFRAYTEGDLYIQWLGPKGYEMIIDKFEPKNNGSYRFIHKDPKGTEYVFHGVYHEVLAPERIIGTFEYDGLPEKGHVEFDTTKFEELPGGRTRVTIQAIYQTVADRDAMVSSGMEHGVKEGFEKLDEVLKKIS